MKDARRRLAMLLWIVLTIPQLDAQDDGGGKERLITAWHEAQAHIAAGRQGAALEPLSRARAVALEIGDERQFINLSGFLQQLQFDLGHHRGVVTTVREAKARLETPSPSNASLFVRLGSNECLSLCVLGRTEESLAVAAAGLHRAREEGDAATRAFAWNLVGSLRHRLDRPVAALEAFDTALEQIGVGHPERPWIEVNRVNALHDLGSFRRVIEFSDVLLASGRLASSDLIVRLRQVRAAALWSLEKPEDALRELDAALGAIAGPADSRLAPGLLLHRALVLRDLERIDEAFEVAEQALEAHRKRGIEDQDLAFALTGLGASHELRARAGSDPKDFAAAEKYRRSAFELARRKRFPDLAQFAAGLGWLLHSGLGRSEEAAQLLELAIEETEQRMVAAVGLRDVERAALHGRHRDRADSDAYEQLARVKITMDDPTGALLALERGRARSLVDRLRVAEMDPFAEAERRAAARGDSEFVAEARRLRKELADAESELAGAAKEGEAHRVRVAALRRRGVEMARGLLPPARKVDMVAIRGMLGPRDALVIYSVGEEDGYAILVEGGAGAVTTHALRDGKVPLRRARAAELVDRYLRTVRARGSRASRGRGIEVKTGSEGLKVGQELMRALVPASLWDRIHEREVVHLVPHGPLHRLPFECLVLETGKDAASSRFWIDVGPIVVYAAAASVFRWSHDRARGTKTSGQRSRLLVVADPLLVDETAPPGFPERGALVATAGPPLRVGDVVLAIDGREIESGAAANTAIMGAERDRRVALRVWRAGRTFELQASLRGLVVEPGAPRSARASLVERNRRGDAAWGARSTLRRLPGARREARAIAKTLDRNRSRLELHLLEGAAASESAVEAAARDARVVHLAGHQLPAGSGGIATGRLVLRDAPLRSGSDDGYLDLDDLLGRWNGILDGCDLVVLSACGSRLGELARDDSLFSLPFGFQAAGCPHVVASLWPVDDASTAELMADFYRRLSRDDWGARPAALRDACRAHRKRHPEPFHWSPFVWVGAAR